MQMLTVLALLGSSALANIPETPRWQTDYGTAKSRVAEIHKPMALVFGEGREGWAKLTMEGKLDSKVNRLLQDYVCVYVDKTTEQGKKLAVSFEVSSNTGLVLSDRDGKLQAFYHDGTLTTTTLVNTLEKYSKVQSPVVQTETVANQVSVVQNVPQVPQSNVSSPVYAPQAVQTVAPTPTVPSYSSPAPSYHQPVYQPVTAPAMRYSPAPSYRSGGS